MNNHLKKHNYFVCSYGGCGSKILTAYLKNFGNVFHIHSNNPPYELTRPGNSYIVEKNKYDEWFTEYLIPDNELNNYTVIYIYRNPVKAIISRFDNPVHLLHIQSNTSITIQDVINHQEDLYGIENFFDNYTIHKKKYNIICLKYEDLFDNIEKLNNILNLPNIPPLYPSKKETNKNTNINIVKNLEKIYENLINKMDKLSFIHINYT